MFASGNTLEQSRGFYWKKESLDEFLMFIDSQQSYHRILDAGCGTGFMTELLANHLETNEVIGVDINPNSLEIAKKRLLEFEKRDQVEYKIGNLHQLDFEDNYFDLAFCHYLLVDCQHAEKVLTEMIRVTKPGGTICCIEPLYQTDMLNCYMPFMNSEELDVMTKVYKKMIIDIPRSMNIDRAIAISLPKRFTDLKVADLKIKLHGNYSCSLDYSDETLEMMKKQSEQVIAQKEMMKQSFKSHPVLQKLSPEEIDSYVATQVKLSETIVNNQALIKESAMFTAGFNLLIKGIVVK